MSEIGHNRDAMLKDFVDRLERLQEERKELQKDFAVLLNLAVEATGFNKSAIQNILKERAKPRSDVHAVHVDMDAIRRALGMPDPLLPPEDEPEPDAAGSHTRVGALVALGDAAAQVVQAGAAQ